MVFHLRMRLRRLRAARGRAHRLNGLWTSCLILSNRGKLFTLIYCTYVKENTVIVMIIVFFRWPLKLNKHFEILKEFICEKDQLYLCCTLTEY